MSRRGLAALAAALCLAPTPAAADARHQEPLVTGVRFERLELGEAGAFAWRADAFARRDLAQLRIESRGAGDDGEVDAAEVAIVYGRALTAFLDVIVGWRAEIEPLRRDWFTVGIEWLAPWHVDVEVVLHVGGAGRTGLRLEAEWPLRLTDRLILVPEAGIRASGRDGPRARRASGIAESELALDLRYEITRKLAPYIGVRWHRRHGDTARLARDAGEDPRDSSLVIGVHAWY